MQAAAPGRTARNRRIEATQRLGLAPGFQLCLAGFKQGVAAFFDAVGSLAHGGALCRSKRRQLGHDLGDAALAAQNIHAQSLKGIQRRSLAQTFFKFRNQAFQCRNQIHSGYPNAARRGVLLREAQKNGNGGTRYRSGLTALPCGTSCHFCDLRILTA